MENNTIKMFKDFMNQMYVKYSKFKKDNFNSWKFCSIEKLKTLMNQHIVKFHDNFICVYSSHFNELQKNKIKDDLIDIANYCLMLYNKLKE